MMTVEKLLLFAFIPIIAGFSYAYADSMQGSGSMPMHENMMGSSNMSSGSMMNENNMSSNSMMGSNMSGWGNSSMKGGNIMMSSGNIDLSMASPVEGSSSAPVTIIEFGDYQCPECDAWFKNQEPAIKANYIDTNKAKLYFVDFPWAGADSIAAAESSYCAGDQGKYWQYHDYLYQNQGGIQSGWASTNNLKSYASSLGLDTNQFNACLDSGKYSDRVTHNKEVGLSKGVQGTPTFFIVGPSGTMQEITGPQPASVFSSSIDQMSTQATPEFGPAAVLVFVIAISTLVIITAKTSLRTIYRH
ncbi:MAG: thioredoxin domain-containing protein [Thaumarchaeota archaeon]|nr:thioredoxin domain-containing protein [Nitrososphaerota archaeon]